MIKKMSQKRKNLKLNLRRETELNQPSVLEFQKRNLQIKNC